jgi:hypothetical protein
MFEIVWHPAAEAALLRMQSWTIAAAVDAGVLALARRGKGELERVGPHHHLRVAGHVVKLRLEAETLTIYVLGVYASR